MLSLAVAGERRELAQATGAMRLSQVIATLSGPIEPYVSGGVRHSWGDRDATSANRFDGAPVGAGAFTIDGATLPAWVGLVGAGLNARVSDRVRFGIAADHTLAKRQREGRVSVNVNIAF